MGMYMQRQFFGTDHMLGQDEYIPYLKDKFEIRLYNIGTADPIDKYRDLNGLPKGTNVAASTGEGPGSFSDTLTLCTQSLGSFKKSYGVIEDFYGNDSIKFAGKPQYQAVQWTIKGYCGLDSQAELNRMDAQVFDAATELCGRPSQYMKDAYVLRDSGTGDDQWSRVWKWRGVWVSEIDWGDCDYTASDIVRFTCTLQVSRAIYLGAVDMPVPAQ